VEATVPNTQIENYDKWEDSLVKRGYHYIYFDGLNRYYLADEHDELDAAFMAPPNYFDHYKRASEDWLEHRTQQLQNELNVAETIISQFKESADQFNRELQSVYASKSWRITWPLRKLMQFFRRLCALPIRITLWLVRLPKRSVRWLLLKAMAYALKHPGLKMRIMARLRKYPNLEAKLRRLAQARGLITVQPDKLSMPIQPATESVESPIPAQAEPESLIPEPAITGNEDTTLASDLSHLTPSARRIYGELKAAMAQHEQENH